MAGIVPELDFTSLADIAKDYRALQDRKQVQAYLQQQGLPPNLSLAQLAMGNKRDERDFALRKDEIARNQKNADRTFDFQREQAAAAGRGFDIKEVDDGMGGKRLVRIERATGNAAEIPVNGGAPAVPANPFAQGKMNDEQGKAALYSSRMFNAEKILREPAVIANATSLKQTGASRIPVLGNYLVSDDYQKFDQAQRDFVNAVLRRESGAVISDSEFDNARKQYLPQPGDSAEKLKQKQANRAEAIRGIAASAGPGFRPENTFDAEGNVAPNPAPRRNAPQPAPQQQGAESWRNRETITAARANPQATLAEAQRAIQANPAHREAVIQRLRAVGITPAALDQVQSPTSGAIY
jgi:hypothetical protein